MNFTNSLIRKSHPNNPIIKFWIRDVNEILPDPDLKQRIYDFLDSSEDEENKTISLLRSAIDRAEETIRLAHEAGQDERIANLEKAGSMTFLQITFDFALSLVGGNIVKFIAHASLKRILKNRLLYGTIRNKIRIKKSGISNKRQEKALIKFKLGKSSKHNKKHKFYDVSMFEEVLIEDNSWENLIFKSLPEIEKEFTSKMIEEKENLSSSSTNQIMQTRKQFFNDQRTALRIQENTIIDHYNNLKSNIPSILKSSMDTIEFIRATQSSIKFEIVNSVNKNQSLDEAILEEEILAQPIIINAVFRSIQDLPSIKPKKRIPARDPGFKPTYTYIGETVLPERIKTSDTKKAYLKVLSETLFVPESLNTKSKIPFTFSKKYSGNPEKAIVELVKYLQKIKTNNFIGLIQRTIVKLISFLRKTAKNRLN